MIGLANSHITKDQETQTLELLVQQATGVPKTWAPRSVAMTLNYLKSCQNTGRSVSNSRNDKPMQTFTVFPSWAMFTHLLLWRSRFMHSQPTKHVADNELFLVFRRLCPNLILYSGYFSRGIITHSFHGWLLSAKNKPANKCNSARPHTCMLPVGMGRVSRNFDLRISSVIQVHL